MLCNMNVRETCLTKKCFYDFYNFFLRYPTLGIHFSKIKNHEPSEKNSYKIQFWQNVQNTMRDSRKVDTWPSCMIILLFYFISSILWSIFKKYPTFGTIPLYRFFENIFQQCHYSTGIIKFMKKLNYFWINPMNQEL